MVKKGKGEVVCPVGAVLTRGTLRRILVQSKEMVSTPLSAPAMGKAGEDGCKGKPGRHCLAREVEHG